MKEACTDVALSALLLYLRSHIYPTHALEEGMHKFKFYLAFILSQRGEKNKTIYFQLHFHLINYFNHKSYKKYLT
jgi:hypothetical protein